MKVFKKHWLVFAQFTVVVIVISLIFVAVVGHTLHRLFIVLYFAYIFWIFYCILSARVELHEQHITIRGFDIFSYKSIEIPYDRINDLSITTISHDTLSSYLKHEMTVILLGSIFLMLKNGNMKFGIELIKTSKWVD